jgi:hypothetical protein
VRKAGTKGYFYRYRTGIDPQGTNWEPDFDDPVFLQKLEHFLAAAGARYDGSPDLAFIDVGTLGAWGEGHTVPSTRRPYSSATALRQIDLYHKYFRAAGGRTRRGIVVKDFSREIEAAVRTLLAPGNYAKYRERAAATRNVAVYEIPEMLNGILATAGEEAARAGIDRGADTYTMENVFAKP